MVQFCSEKTPYQPYQCIETIYVSLTTDGQDGNALQLEL